jgi:TusA-related sulfurtransferase
MTESTTIHARVDVTDQVCPLSFVKAKLALEDLEIGQHLEVRLLGGEARHNVPRSFEGEGQRVFNLHPEAEDESIWRLTVERVR